VIVVDASLGVKWFFEEKCSAAALTILTEHTGFISVPDIFGVEVMSALVRAANIQKSKAAEMRLEIERFEQILASGSLLTVVASPSHTIQAANIAIDLSHPLKDCIYLVLAMQFGCPLVTSDAKFADRAKDIWPQVQILEDIGT
jgi:predicted nucleic acid-binding protein